jgi:hypothetical protein
MTETTSNTFDDIDDDDDDEDYLSLGFDHVFVPVLVGTGTIISLCIASAAGFATLWLWVAAAKLLHVCGNFCA